MSLSRAILFIIFVMPLFSFGQDLHFSQFFNSPLVTNPANTGFIPDADFRVGGSFRNQFSSIMRQPYKTMSFFADAQVFRDRLENGWLGIGGVILSDVAGEGSLRSTKIYGSVAYHQMLGNSSLLSAGFNLGWANKRINPSQFKFPDQYDGEFFDSDLPTSVIFSNTSVSYFDMQAGINYAYFPHEDVYINGGYSIHHVNRPKETFFANPVDGGLIPIKHIGFLNASLKMSNRLIINPNMYYSNQSGANEWVGGLNGAINLKGNGDAQLIGGVYYRFRESFIPVVGFVLKNIHFVFSYDATVSNLKEYNQMRGAHEISIIAKGFYREPGLRQVLCPTF